MRATPGVALLAMVMLAQLVQAEDLVEIYELARSNDADYRAAEATLRASLEDDPQARAALRPQVDLGADASYIDVDAEEGSFDTDDDYTQTNLTLSLSQSLYRRDLNVQLEQVNASVAQARAEFAAVEEELIFRVADSYFDVLEALDNVEFAGAEKEAIAQQLEQAQRRFEVGLIAITDVKEAQARFDLAVAQEIEADNTLAITREALRVLTGTPFEGLLRVKDDAPLPAPDPADIEQWVLTAQEQNSVLLAARQATEVARQGIELNRSDNFPTLDLVAQYGYRDNSGGFNEGETNTASIGVQLNYPLYTSGAISSRVAQARAEFDAAREREEKQRRLTAQQVRDAFLSVIAAISRVRALLQARASTQAGYEATQAGFEVGTRTSVEVLIALRETFLAQQNYARARYDYIRNHLRLRQTAGILTEQDLERIARWLE